MKPKELGKDKSKCLKNKKVKLNAVIKILIQKSKDINIKYSEKIKNTDNDQYKCKYRLLKIKELKDLKLEKDKKKHEIELLKIEIASIQSIKP